MSKTLQFLLISILLTNISIFAQDFEVPILVSDGAFNTTITIGVDPSGTDGFDPGLDIYAPPQPFPGAFDARSRFLSEDYIKDIRGNAISQKQFSILYQVSSGNGPIVLSWDNSALSALGTFSIVDNITGTLYGPLDMTTVSSLAVTDPLITNGLRILVTPIDNSQQPPELDPISNQSMNEGETLPVGVSSTDPNGDNITLSVENLPSFGSFVDNGDGTGTITYTTGFDDDGSYPNIRVIATDDGTPSLSDTTIFTLTVNDVNREPDLYPISNQSMDEGETLPVSVSSTDPDGDNITLAIENLPTFGSFVDNGDGTGTITFTTGFEDDGSYPNIRVIATDDGSGPLSDTTTFTLTVNDVNREPGLDPISNQSMNEGETLPVGVSSTDPDGDNITLAVENLPTFGSFVDNGDGTGTITFTTGFDDDGSYPNIRVIATDDGTPSLSDSTTFTLTVGDENQPPELTVISNQNMDEGETLPVGVSSTDRDGDIITLAVENLPTFGSFVDNGDGTGTITITPGYDDDGSYPNIRVIATDDGTPSLSDTTIFTLTVNDVNREPDIDDISNQSMNEGGTLNIPVSSTDPDGNSITLTAVNLPSFGNLTDNSDGSGSISFTPAVGQNGTYQNINIIATDNGNPILSDTTSFELDVSIVGILAPTNLTADPSVAGFVDLSWTDNSSNEDGFIIQRDTESEMAWASIDTVGNNITSYSNSNVLHGAFYKYRVLAYNVSTQSNPSNTANIVTFLPAPFAFVASISDFGSLNIVELTWNDSCNNESGFYIERGLSMGNGNVNYQLIDSVNANTLIYRDTLAVVDSVSYRINAFTDYTVSAYAEPDWVIPVELTSFAANISNTSVLLSWTTATETNNRGFQIERNLNDQWESIGFIDGNGTTTAKSFYTFTDDFKYQSHKGIIQYRLKQVDFDGSYEYSNIIEINLDLTPMEYTLYQNYPNPFNPSTKIKFALPDEGNVSLTIYDLLGNKIDVLVDEKQDAGYHEVEFNATNLASGIYYYKLETDDYVSVKKMIFLK